MRVLFLTHSFPRYTGDAAGSFILRLASALTAADVAVRVMTPSADGLAAVERIGQVEVVRFRYAPRRFETLAYTGNMASQVRESWSARAALAALLLSASAAAIRHVRDFSPDLIHAHWWFPNAIVGDVASRITRTPMVTTLHGTDIRMARAYPVSRGAFRGVVRRSVAVTAVSRWLAEEAHDMSGVTPIVAPMPVDTNSLTPLAGTARAGRLLFVGRLTAQKGGDLLLHALAALPSEIGLDVVGDGDERSRLESLAQSLGVSHRVVWHGTRPGHALASYYRAAAAVIVPSLDEGLGLVAVEAHLCETPVVAFASGGLTDVLEDGVTGILVQQRQPATLAAAVAELLARPDRGAALGRAGRAWALSRFDPAVVAQRYIDIYRDGLGRTNR
ncbi:MAG: glycosyltransferase family 4 protein [Gemmatimonadaceae bacterium]